MESKGEIMETIIEVARMHKIALTPKHQKQLSRIYRMKGKEEFIQWADVAFETIKDNKILCDKYFYGFITESVAKKIANEHKRDGLFVMRISLTVPKSFMIIMMGIGNYNRNIPGAIVTIDGLVSFVKE